MHCGEEGMVVKGCSQGDSYDTGPENSESQGLDISFKGSPLKTCFYQQDPTSQCNVTSWKICILNIRVMEDILNLVLVTFLFL